MKLERRGEEESHSNWGKKLANSSSFGERSYYRPDAILAFNRVATALDCSSLLI